MIGAGPFVLVEVGLSVGFGLVGVVPFAFLEKVRCSESLVVVECSQVVGGDQLVHIGAEPVHVVFVALSLVKEADPDHLVLL